MKNYDVCIVGGGMIGAAMALGLARLKKPLRILLLEHQKPQSFDREQCPDLRLSAFNLHAINLFKQLGAWQHIENTRLRPYSRLSVWEDATAATTFDAKDIGQDKLGYFIENRLVQLGLLRSIQDKYEKHVDIKYGEMISAIDTSKGNVQLESGLAIQAKMILGADGAQSLVRKASKIVTSGWQYKQSATAILVKLNAAIPDTTWQQFYSTGPRALLPMYDNHACLVWYDEKHQSNKIQQADNRTLKHMILRAFPPFLPSFEIIGKASFPIARMHAHRYGQGKSIILGDAAHTINPLAGQGVNLGFKDVATLLELIEEQGIESVSDVCTLFEKSRKGHNLAMMTAMDVIYSVFSNEALPLRIIRQVGLKVANQTGPIKAKVLRYAMGIS
ncbi:FAD-dependent monooxygenase [Glaciecola petra]|uniref:FAD-dependent monooxygenase n=1 Tax=Glaciecola petra TaxID=3075602 RepID=A0ABU2ZNL5_9ALTE|nr:FAD-dependent monooxygenase [Aestuariibacter sp. P117]MDT0593990.1 FAD-dependent monooxygenase [Aestuariibacter sp. P117]